MRYVGFDVQPSAEHLRGSQLHRQSGSRLLSHVQSGGSAVPRWMVFSLGRLETENVLELLHVSR